MENVEKATGYINFDSNGDRSNYTIHIHRSALAMPLAKVNRFIYYVILFKKINYLKLDWLIFDSKWFKNTRRKFI
jgi:hypothetical protein